MSPQALDTHGDLVVSNWLNSPHANPRLTQLLFELLDDLRWGRPLQHAWDVRRDQTDPTDRLVYLPDSWVVVVRMFSDEDPEHMFSILSIVQVR
ncbi:MAG: hypothetical protein ACRDYU_08015 [Actinomycetes bacterium]